MVTWRVLVQYKPSFTDHRGKVLEREWRASGRPPVRKIRTGQAYELEGELTEADVRRLAERLLADPVTQTAEVVPAERSAAPRGVRRAEVWPKDGVSDPVAETVRVGARDLDLARIEKARSGALYDFWGARSDGDVKKFCESFLMNDLVQKVEILS